MIRLCLPLLVLAAPLAQPAAQQTQVRFGETQVVVETWRGRKTLKVQFARTPEQLRRGLMFRRTIKPWDGMLFDMGLVQQGSFWMRNTLIPLDIVFIKADGTVDSVGQGKPLSLDPVESKGPIKGVLELRRGRAAALGIQPGSIIRHRIFGNARQ